MVAIFPTYSLIKKEKNTTNQGNRKSSGLIFVMKIYSLACIREFAQQYQILYHFTNNANCQKIK
jgi:hypothetical protein